jgi:hypothetical protein
MLVIVTIRRRRDNTKASLWPNLLSRFKWFTAQHIDARDCRRHATRIIILSQKYSASLPTNLSSRKGSRIAAQTMLTPACLRCLWRRKKSKGRPSRPSLLLARWPATISLVGLDAQLAFCLSRLTPIERLLNVNDAQLVSLEIVETVRDSLVIGQA